MDFMENYKETVNQKDFLKDAMQQLGMNREQFAERLGTNLRRITNWLQSTDSKEFREMGSMVWKFVREILEHEKLKQ